MSESAAGGASRLFAVIRALAEQQQKGGRVTHIAAATGLKPATTHRLIQSLVQEGIVEQDTGSKRYRLGIEFFALAAKAGNVHGLRNLCRPVLLRLGARLNDAVFLLVRSGYDAICLDRNEGPYPIRTFTGDIGGRVALGVGQGPMAILAFLPEAVQEDILQYNLPRLRDFGVYDEVYLRSEIAHIRREGYCARSSGLLPGMAGVAVPIFDREGNAVAALSIGTLTERLNEERLPVVTELLKKEAEVLSKQINPFDPTLRRPWLGSVE
ncbi:IclR family transcriptional regulator [Brenneria goodwinii]|uniref:Transcriptional regulator, IclR family n=1 Tax=Brenneria goodwinii TaxID=1109412 RepID=A0A0G4JYA1_9GAMM|nr:IclR family transcriptional regulator [Brenneria goodwinii]CPR18651.1 Transcriptional regulator, IclR family [Brenneria goodwinii]